MTSDETGMTYHIEAIPKALVAKADRQREALVETLSGLDEDLANAYLEGAEISAELLRKVIRKTTIDLEFCPVIPGSAFKNKGVQMLLDSVVAYLPAPIDLPAIEAEDIKGKPVHIESDDNSSLTGLAFKLMTDSFVGKLVFFRIYSGCLKKGAALLNPRTGKTERIARILLMKANAREDIDVAYSGDICALVGLRQVVTGDTLCEKNDPIRLEPPTFPETVISMSIEPKTTLIRIN